MPIPSIAQSSPPNERATTANPSRASAAGPGDSACGDVSGAAPASGSNCYILDWSRVGDDTASAEGLLATGCRLLASDADRLLVVARGATERTKIRIARLLADAGLRLSGVAMDEGGCTFLEARLR